MYTFLHKISGFILSTTSLLLGVSAGLAQPIIPANDGTGTTVTQQENKFNIQGGKLSGDETNLFHSFEQLGLSQGQILNFLSDPEIHNILGRVTGGSVSVIDGLIQITGGNSNLFLINPAGVIFGENAALNLPASLTVTTANSIGFENGNWFDAIGNSDWTTLVGTPNQFLFNPEQSGSIINLGNLTVPNGENLNLIAGNIVNTGTLAAPSGQIMIGAIPGENLVKLSQVGQLLSLEVSTAFNSDQSLEVQPLNLPRLLTGGNAESATHIQQNQQGEFILTTQPESGVAFVSGEIDVSNSTNSTVAGNIYVLGNHLAIVDASLNASGVKNGGNIFIGGDSQGLGYLPLASQVSINQNSIIKADGVETGDGGNIVIWSEHQTTIAGNITVSGGNISGNGGFVETSSSGLLDIINAPDTSAAFGSPGTWLIDPINLEIVADEFDIIDDGITSFILVDTLIEGLQSGNVELTTGTDNSIAGVGNIRLNTDLDFNGIGFDRTLTLNAANNITINDHDIFDQIPGNDSLNLIFNADLDNNGSGSVNLNNATVELGGGDFTANGSQILIFQTSLMTSEEGSINLTGNLTEPGSNRSVVAIVDNSQIIAENGVINISGINQVVPGDNDGMNPPLPGDNAGMNPALPGDNDGIILQNSLIESTGDGFISLTGISGNGEASEGILISDFAIIQSNNGEIILEGTGNGMTLSPGISIKDSSLVSTTGNGNISLAGINNSLGQDNDGILLLENATLETLGTGNIILNGISNPGERSQGVSIRLDSTIQSAEGTVTVEGNGNKGILIESSQIESDGDVNLAGVSNGSDGNNDGIVLLESATVSTTGTGEVTLNGSSGTGTNSRGVASLNNSQIRSENGAIQITGTSEPGESNSILLRENTNITSNGNGDIVISGNQDISSGNITTQGGNIALSSTAGGVNSNGTLATRSTTASSGTVAVNATENITVNNIDTSTSSEENTANAGTITVDAGNNNIILNGNIEATATSGSGGNLNFSSPVQLNQTATVINTAGNTGGGDVNFTNSLDGTTANNNNLTINSGSGNVTFNETVGNQTPLGNLNVNSGNTTVFNNSVNAGSVTTDAAGTLQLNGDVTTSNNLGQTYNDTVTISNNVILTADELNFAATVTGNNVDLTLQPFTPTQAIILGGTPTTDTNSLEFTGTELNLLQNGFSNIIIGRTDSSGTISLAGDSIFQDPVTLRSPVGTGNINTVGFTLTGTDNATLNLEANQTISTGNLFNAGRTISLNSNSGDINTTAGILNTSSTITNGGIVEFNAAGNIIIGSVNLSTSSPDAESRAGTLSLNTNQTVTFTGNVEASATAGSGNNLIVNSTLNLTQPTLIRTAGNAGSGDINFNQVINGNNFLTVDAGTGTVNFQNAVGNLLPLTGLNITASEINSNADITVAGDVTLNVLGNVNFGETLTLVTPSTLNIAANQNIVTRNINNAAGTLNLTSLNGTIDTSLGTLSTGSTTGNGGTVILNAVGNLILGDIDVSTTSPSTLSQAGTLQLNTAQNNIILRGNINASATSGQGSSLNFNSAVQLQDSVILNTAGGSGSGVIRFNNSINDTTGNNILTLTAGTGDVNLNGVGNLLAPQGLNIAAETVTNNTALTVGSAGLDLNANTAVNLNGTVTSDGNIAVIANGQINTRDIVSAADLRLTTPGGNINTGNLSTAANTTPGGDIIVNSNSGSITTGNLSASGTTGGEIVVAAETAITAGNLDTSGSVGDGGNIMLDPVGDVEVGYINAEGGSNGSGGNVTVESTGGFFRATNAFPTAFSPTGTASISTASPTEVGSIIIRHAGGELTPPVEPFQVGNASINGTVAAITTGTSTIAPSVILPDSVIQGNINIETDDLSPSQIAMEEREEIPLNDEEMLENLTTTINNESLSRNLNETTGITIKVEDGSELRFSGTELLSDYDVAFQGQNIDVTLLQLEQSRNREFEEYFGIDAELRDRQNIQKILKQIEAETEDRYGIVYVVSREHQLELIVVAADGSPIRRSIPEANREKLLLTVRQLQVNLIRSRSRNRNSYQPAAQQLYEWMITPIEADLEQRGITTLLFSFDAGFRSIPIGALWDGERFFTEKYNYSLIPSISLINTDHSSLKNAKVLIMGASTFEEQNPLPAVPLEANTILQFWKGQSFLNEAFTLENLKIQRRLSDFSLIHLATHADFQGGTSENSYIQLWDRKLSLTQLPLLNWGNPPVELLVLSACRTAIGSREAELGFAGLALQSGVKSAIASLWYVSDQGTLALMSQFYADLKQTSIKAAALRQAQLAMIQGNIRVENSQLKIGDRTIPLPPNLTDLENEDLSHPYYWAGFTVIGTPW